MANCYLIGYVLLHFLNTVLIIIMIVSGPSQRKTRQLYTLKQPCRACVFRHGHSLVCCTNILHILNNFSSFSYIY